MFSVIRRALVAVALLASIASTLPIARAQDCPEGHWTPTTPAPAEATYRAAAGRLWALESALQSRLWVWEANDTWRWVATLSFQAIPNTWEAFVFGETVILRAPFSAVNGVASPGAVHLDGPTGSLLPLSHGDASILSVGSLFTDGARLFRFHSPLPGMSSNMSVWDRSSWGELPYPYGVTGLFRFRPALNGLFVTWTLTQPGPDQFVVKKFSSSTNTWEDSPVRTFDMPGDYASFRGVRAKTERTWQNDFGAWSGLANVRFLGPPHFANWAFSTIGDCPRTGLREVSQPVSAGRYFYVTGSNLAYLDCNDTVAYAARNAYFNGFVFDFLTQRPTVMRSTGRNVSSELGGVVSNGETVGFAFGPIIQSSQGYYNITRGPVMLWRPGCACPAPKTFVPSGGESFSSALLPSIVDISADSFLAFGGRTAANADIAATKIWQNNTWTLATGPQPSPRADHAVVTAELSWRPDIKAVLFGGKQANNQVLGDMWTWSGTAWTQRGAINPPSARGGHAMAFWGSSPILFGGFDGSGQLLPAETHRLNFYSEGPTWERLDISNPPARAGHVMAFDPMNTRIVLFGGNGESGFLGDTWTYDYFTWTQHTGPGPSPRQYASMHWDETLGGVRLIGGRDANFQVLDDQWLFTAAGWQLLPERLPGGPRWAHASASTPDGKQIIAGGLDAFGNVRSDTLISTTAPVIRQEPQSLTRSVNQTAIFNVISNDPNASYQWYLNALPIIDSLRITGSASPQLTISGVTLADAGAYTVSISNCGGTTTSTPTTLTVTTCDPIDFNNNSLFPEDQDLIDFFSVFAGGSCSPGNTCNDIDFNNDGLFPDDNDLVAFLTVLAGGNC